MRRDRLLREVLRQRFVVTLTTGETFAGLLDQWDDNYVTFLDGYAITETTRNPVDGALYLPRTAIAYMQRPGTL